LRTSNVLTCAVGTPSWHPTLLSTWVSRTLSLTYKEDFSSCLNHLNLFYLCPVFQGPLFDKLLEKLRHSDLLPFQQAHWEARINHRKGSGNTGRQ
jgi:hypothetical protein